MDGVSQLTDSRPWNGADTTRGNPGADRTPVLLIVDPDPSARRKVARSLATRAIARTAGTVEHARRLLHEHPLAAVVLELDLEDGCAIALLGEVASETPRRPVLVVSGTDDILRVSRACLLGASFVSKREPDVVLRRRIAELVDRAQRRRGAAEVAVDGVCRAAKLTRAEREAVLAFVLTTNRGALRARLGIAETSVRSRVRGACRKLGIAHLHDVFRLLFDQAVAA